MHAIASVIHPTMAQSQRYKKDIDNIGVLRTYIAWEGVTPEHLTGALDSILTSASWTTQIESITSTLPTMHLPDTVLLFRAVPLLHSR